MGFKDIIAKLKGKSENNDELKDYIKELDKKSRAEKIVLDKQKSANQRELERYYREDNEAKIKEELEFMRKKRQFDINHNHNPLHTPNIFTRKKTDWEILKERPLFHNHKNIFTNQKNIFKNSPHLFQWEAY